MSNVIGIVMSSIFIISLILIFIGIVGELIKWFKEGEWNSALIIGGASLMVFSFVILLIFVV